MSAPPVTLDRFILEQQHAFPGATGELSLLLMRFAVAGKRQGARHRQPPVLHDTFSRHCSLLASDRTYFDPTLGAPAFALGTESVALGP